MIRESIDTRSIAEVAVHAYKEGRQDESRAQHDREVQLELESRRAQAETKAPAPIITTDAIRAIAIAAFPPGRKPTERGISRAIGIAKQAGFKVVQWDGETPV